MPRFRRGPHRGISGCVAAEHHGEHADDPTVDPKTQSGGHGHDDHHGSHMPHESPKPMTIRNRSLNNRMMD